MPVYQLLGGSNRSDIKAYASLLKYQDPEVTAKVTRDALDEGYEYIKLHECTVAPVRGAREEAGDGVPIMVDVNCLWTPEETIAFANDVAPYDLHWLEEPVWPPENFHGLAEVRMATDTWIAAGENACTAWQFREMFEAEATKQWGQDDDAIFDQYAQMCLDEWVAQGKNPKPMELVLQKQRATAGKLT